MAEGKIYQYRVGYSKFYYEHSIVNNRDSLEEFNRDIEVRQKLWKVGVGDYAIDIGAGFGAFTLTALASACAFVLSFEQDPDIASVLKHNLYRNHTLSAAERSSLCRWHLDDSNSIDKFLEGLSYKVPRLDWIRIDLGSIPDNRLVLNGCRNSIKEYKPNILIKDTEVPKYSFLELYSSAGILNGHTFISPIR